MIRKYTYKEKVYRTPCEVRQAIWDQEQTFFPDEPKEGRVEFWAALGVTYTEEPDPEPTEEELAERVRRQRDYRIGASDFYMMPDYPSEPEALEAVKTYRQALRDITAQEGFPKSVTWPEAPAVLLKQPEKNKAIAKAKEGLND